MKYIRLRLYDEVSQESLKTWDWPETDLRLTWDWPETETDLGLPWDWPKTDLGLTQTALRWRLRALDKLSLNRQTDRRTKISISRAPDGAKNILRESHKYPGQYSSSKVIIPKVLQHTHTPSFYPPSVFVQSALQLWGMSYNCGALTLNCWLSLVLSQFYSGTLLFMFTAAVTSIL